MFDLLWFVVPIILAASIGCGGDGSCDDVGCPAERPFCYDQPGGWCIECRDDADCEAGEHCDSPNEDGNGDCLLDREEGDGDATP